MNWEKTTFRDRFKWARTKAKKTQQEVADRIGLRRNSISYWESGKNEAEGRNLELASEYLNVDTTWLDTGKGDPGIYTPREIESYESATTKILLQHFSQSDKRGRETILAIAKIESDRATKKAGGLFSRDDAAGVDDEWDIAKN